MAWSKLRFMAINTFPHRSPNQILPDAYVPFSARSIALTPMKGSTMLEFDAWPIELLFSNHSDSLTGLST
jgi:hypothetical protein